MKRGAKLVVIAILLAAVGFFFGIPLLVRVTGPPGLSFGSYEHAILWRDKLATCRSLDDVRQQFRCGRYQTMPGGSYRYVEDPNTNKEGITEALLYDFANGDWLAIAYANSHNTWGGGTVVTRDNKGDIHVFFGHVCGKPFVLGESLEEVYAALMDPVWKEITPAELAEHAP